MIEAADKGKLAKLLTHGVPVNMADALERHIARGPAHELHRANPRCLAATLGLSIQEALKLITYSVYEGYLALHWQVGCPACGAIEGKGALREITHDAQCKICGNKFHPHLDEEVSVTVTPHPSLRAIPAPAAAHHDDAAPPVKGLELLLLPEFRRLFPREKTLPEESIEIRKISVLFTDLAASTALYAEKGDSRAFHLVRSHFALLDHAVNSNAGVVVKTIGDAVMAVFSEGQSAVRAAIQMHEMISRLNSNLPHESSEKLGLKIGIHCGPSVTVSLNDRADFFGTTVNIAARVQGLSECDEIVISEALLQCAGVEPLAAGGITRRFRARVKGIPEELSLVVLR